MVYLVSHDNAYDRTEIVAVVETFEEAVAQVPGPDSDWGSWHIFAIPFGTIEQTTREWSRNEIGLWVEQKFYAI